MKTEPVYVIGHKNPDADSICSAVGYAAFKHAQGLKQYVPARCGNSNARIDAILAKFKTPLPMFLGDVTPRVKDIMKPKPFTAKLKNTCAEALAIIDKYDIRALPVLDDDHGVQGVITIFRLGEYFTPKINDPLEMRRVNTCISDVIRALDAKVICATNPDSIEELFIRVGAMDIRSFDKSQSYMNIPANQSVIIVGDRWDIQEKSIKLGTRLIVITGDLDVDADIVEHAKAEGVSLIVSPHDTATTAWIIRTATLIGSLVEPVKANYRPDDTIAMVRRRTIEQSTAPLNLVTDAQNRLLGVFSKTDLLKPVKTRLVLVDHNEMSQAIDGAHEVNIEEIIDHHRIGSFTTDQPILFRNEPVGSTSTIIADLFRKHNLKPEANVAGVLMAGVIADTLNLNSPTTTQTDHEVVEWLAPIADTRREELAELIFSSGSVILSEAPDKVISLDSKDYTHGEETFSVSQIEELGFDNFWKHDDALMEALEEYRKTNQLLFSALLVTDVNKQNSLMAIVGDRRVIETISYPLSKKAGIFVLKSVVSRKKQLIPYLTSSLKNVGIL